ncbi:ABC transporter substrate-binding protein [Paenibacillus sp. FSL R7-0048]|uniref:ABC transporter substrate-binding protein n=1 Tax=Paenibacillus TaxID=44249 RepID=UPI00096D6D1C|nr:ABC transporter substrate-binding protein [Paenibacillus odorifer]OMD70144.1 ABC transporter substrate-binding protein [Paenibacillus odorifer]OMD83608.1 ABC transporter substrate-binding protein [Paenibacillus odorifer]
MKTKAKLISMALVTIMLMGIFTGCSSSNNDGNELTPQETTGINANSSDSGKDSATKDPFEITMALPVFGPIPVDIELVQNEISNITKEKINATVKILPISIGSYNQQMNLMSSSGEKLDMYISLSSMYNSEVSTGKYIELDNLVDIYGQDLKAQFDSVYLNSAKIDGKLYGIPVLKDFTTGVPGILMRKDLVEKYKIDISSIKSIDDLDQVFQTIKDNEPAMTPLGVGVSAPLSQYLWYDKLSDRYGVLPEFDNGLKVENIFESKEYEDALKTMHRWFKAGYINKDAATSQANSSDMVKANKAFSYFVTNKPGTVEGDSRLTNHEMVVAPLKDRAYSTTSDTLLALWGISVNSKNPERTMMLLNLMYSDPDIANLLTWGIEGKHYVKVTDTTIDFPAGIDAKTVGYSNQNWIVGNPLLTYTFKTEPVDKWEQVKQANANATKSKALGFLFNTEPVKNEMTALKNVLTQYEKVLETGTIDPTDKLDEFNTKLKAAGIEKVIAEKQKQLDEWAAANQ